MRRLVINADDFGYHSPRNRAVIELIESGRLTSTTVLLNQPGSREALDYVKTSGRPCFGLHLNLSEGIALSGNRPLEASKGRPVARTSGIVRHLDFYYREIGEQFRRANDLFTPTHVDGHFHVHARPLFWLPVARSMKRHGMNKLRRYFTYLTRQSNQHLAKRLAKKAFDAYLLGANHFKTTDYLFDLHYALEHRELLLRTLPADCTVEIMTHPDVGENRDYQTLKSESFQSFLAEGQFHLVTFGQI